MKTYAGWNDMCEISSIVGLTLKEITKNADEELIFVEQSGRVFKMWHDQDCCESVTLEDVAGDLNDLIGNPILKAEEVQSEDWGGDGPDPHHDEWRDSYTWTFYHISTIKGTVTLRWYGESNGYYSESVDFAECPQ